MARTRLYPRAFLFALVLLALPSHSEQARTVDVITRNVTIAQLIPKTLPICRTTIVDIATPEFPMSPSSNITITTVTKCPSFLELFSCLLLINVAITALVVASVVLHRRASANKAVARPNQEKHSRSVEEREQSRPKQTEQPHQPKPIGSTNSQTGPSTNAKREDSARLKRGERQYEVPFVREADLPHQTKPIASNEYQRELLLRKEREEAARLEREGLEWEAVFASEEEQTRPEPTVPVLSKKELLAKLAREEAERLEREEWEWEALFASEEQYTSPGPSPPPTTPNPEKSAGFAMPGRFV
jgi:hypothetical protein